MDMEIEFRGIAADCKRGFVYGNAVFDYSGECYILNWFNKLIEPEVNLWEPTHEFIDIKQETLGQYTNVTDNNDKKVFVGDIVGPVMDCCNGENCEIVFYDGCFCAKWKDKYRTLNKTSLSAWIEINDTSHYDFTIKGNIHENPELLIWKN